jgi:branched-chain amino acid aminotransferase
MLFSDPSGKISKEAPQVSFLDHGFLFGDSIYEVIRLYDGKMFGFRDHMERLQASADRIRLKIDQQIEGLESRVKALFKEGGEKNAVIRIVVTRGQGKLHIDPRSCGEALVFMAHWSYDDSQLPEAVRVLIPQVRRNPRESLDPAIKSGNYLNNIMAFQEAIELGYDDALMLNPSGEITELTTSNVGWFVDEKLETPSTDTGILHGITRKHFLESTRARVVSFGVDRLHKASEAFVLSTLKEVLPIREIRMPDGEIKKFDSFKRSTQLRKDFRLSIQKALESEEQVV